MTKKAINQSEFLEFSEALQLQMLHRDGAYTGKRIVNGQTTILFQLYGFYVEVQYKLYRKDVHRIITSDTADILTPYLDQIKVEDLDNKKKKDQE